MSSGRGFRLISSPGRNVVAPPGRPRSRHVARSRQSRAIRSSRSGRCLSGQPARPSAATGAGGHGRRSMACDGRERSHGAGYRASTAVLPGLTSRGPCGPTWSSASPADARSAERKRSTIRAVERRRRSASPERMAEERRDPLEPVGHRPGRQVEASRRRGHILTGVEVGLKRLDELLAEPLVGEQRAEFAPHGGVRETGATTALEAHLVAVHRVCGLDALPGTTGEQQDCSGHRRTQQLDAGRMYGAIHPGHEPTPEGQRACPGKSQHPSRLWHRLDRARRSAAQSATIARLCVPAETCRLSIADPSDCNWPSAAGEAGSRGTGTALTAQVVSSPRRSDLVVNCLARPLRIVRLPAVHPGAVDNRCGRSPARA